jgi:hypothetical protein
MRLRIVSLIVLALSHTPVPAQSTFASITGSVSDSTGALMPGVQIEVREINTGYTYKAETNENGLYTIANIREGTFTLRASKAGFADFTVDKVLLTALDNRRVDVRLQVGTVGTTVEVSGGATLIETESARIADVKDRETMRALPLTLRRAWDYFTLSPQINKTTAGFQVSFAGSRQQQGAANIDGTTIQRSGGGFASGPLLDRTESFSELRMDISGTSAEFGQIGQVTLISRAGTNDFHGTYSDYYSTTAFRVRNPFALERSSGVSHRMTFAAGGPIIIPKIYNGRNKTFVFGTLEIGFGSPGRTQINQSVPAVPWRSGDFSSLLPGTVVRDPLNGNEPFPNNRIPANRINPAAKILQDEFLALPNFGDPNTFAALNYRELRTNIVAHQPTLTLRVDHRFNDKAFIYGRLTKVDWNLNNWESLPTIKDRYERSRTLRAATIAYTHSLKPNLLNEFRWGSSYDNLPNVSAINGKQLVERLGLRGGPARCRRHCGDVVHGRRTVSDHCARHLQALRPGSHSTVSRSCELVPRQSQPEDGLSTDLGRLQRDPATRRALWKPELLKPFFGPSLQRLLVGCTNDDEPRISGDRAPTPQLSSRHLRAGRLARHTATHIEPWPALGLLPRIHREERTASDLRYRQWRHRRSRRRVESRQPSHAARVRGRARSLEGGICSLDVDQGR